MIPIFNLSIKKQISDSSYFSRALGKTTNQYSQCDTMQKQWPQAGSALSHSYHRYDEKRGTQNHHSTLRAEAHTI